MFWINRMLSSCVVSVGSSDCLSAQKCNPQTLTMRHEFRDVRYHSVAVTDDDVFKIVPGNLLPKPKSAKYVSNF